MRKLPFDELVGALREAGVREGDVVHVQSDLLRVGPVEAGRGREEILSFYLRAFREALGPGGTLTVLTAFEDYGRYQTPFVREESPSRTDTFSEYVRTRPGAVRSAHPIMSLTGIGARAEEICGGAHYEGLGYDSPWGRLHRANALIMTLGLGPDLGGTTFFHYVESLYGVPYKYTKIYRTPVYANGAEVPGPFTLSVRYLDFGIVNTPVRLKWRLLDVGKARNVRTGNAETWCARANDIVDEFVDRLRGDRYYLLEKPPNFRPGDVPMDGPTGDLRVHYDKGREAAPAR